MTRDGQARRRIRWQLWTAFAVLAFLLAVVIVPPYLNVARYKGRVSSLLSASLGRPVRLSSVEVRLLPRPGFVLTDLTVEEDPAYGSEPLLHANSVTVSIRLMSLWRGLEISRISVDEASLNLVRTPAGRWNVESLFRTVANPSLPRSGAAAKRKVPLPYLEATESRINIKNGQEKLPFSVVNADLSFWEDDPGEWRIRLRGQPARTDLSLDLADTGVIRIDADLHRAPELRQIPMRVDMEWNEAQLGQLTRLLIGSDPGWRGNLTGELHLDGSADSAMIQTRLRASGVHRVEFAPASPMDFDATCKIAYRYSTRAMQALDCSSPVGDGRLKVGGGTGDDFATPHFNFELDRIPVEFGLDLLRTVRSAFDPSLEAKGTVSGSLKYVRNTDATSGTATPQEGKAHKPKTRAAPQGPLTGSLTVQGFELSGNGLDQPIRINKVTLEPASAPIGKAPGQFEGLSATASIPAGAASPLTVTSRLGLSGYQVAVHGQASIVRLRGLAHLAGVDDQDAEDAASSAAFSALTGDAVGVDVNVAGPWLAPETTPFASSEVIASAARKTDHLSGTLNLHNADWKAEFLANPIHISQASLHLEDGGARWDPVEFSYGPVKGTGSLTVPAHCDAPPACTPEFRLEFGALDTAELEAAILGARVPGTLLSSLIARISPSKTPAWPELTGSVKAGSLILGPIKLEQPTATLHIHQDGAEITGFEAGVLGGSLQGSGEVHAASAAGNEGGKPRYALEGQFQHLSPPAVGQLLGARWSGGDLNGSGKIDLSGYTSAELSSSANGSLHFEWRHGSVSSAAGSTTSGDVGDPTDLPDAPVPPVLNRFDNWTADAAIAKGGITLGNNQVQRGAHRSAVTGTVTLATPAHIALGSANEARAAKR